MTYIEFFDRAAPKNIITCLTQVPDRVVLIGDDNQMSKYIENYKRVFADRGHHIEFIIKNSSKNNLEHSVNVVTEMVNTYDDCVFDVTGGGELLLVALGIVYQRLEGANIQIHQYNFMNNALVDCDKDGNTVFRDPPKLSAVENIRIHGGDIVYGDVDEERTYLWDLNPEFVSDVNRIWKLCKSQGRFWNKQIGLLTAAQAIGQHSSDGLTTVVSKVALENHLAQFHTDYHTVRGILPALLNAGLLTQVNESEKTLTVSYKNPQVKRCLTRAGQALEMKIFTTAKKVLDKEGKPVYDDALNGVVIDWDGEFHGEKEQLYDTENEIDVLLMHNIIPVFISCKNGGVTVDELYKLNTVAARFGGQHAKKVLVTGSLGVGGAHLRQRAQDMKIRLLDNVHQLSESELERKIISLWFNT